AVSGFEISVGTINAGQKIPGVNIQIILNSGYTADKSKLLVKIDDLGIAQKKDLTISKILDAEYNAKLENATKVLADSLIALDFVSQQELIKSWDINPASTEFEDEIKGILTFNYGGVDLEWDEVVKDVTLKTNISGTEAPLTKISPVEIQINLNDEYIASTNGGLLTFNSADTLGNWNQINLTINEISNPEYKNKLEAATKVLADLLTALDFAAQKNMIDNWNNNPAPVGFEDEIKGIITFSDGSNDLDWDIVVKNVTLTTKISGNENPSDKITPVEIQINLNDEYKALVGEDLLTFKSADTLGIWNSINLVITNSADHSTKVTAIETYLENEFAGKADNTEQQEFYNGLENTIPPQVTQEIIDIVTFKEGANDIPWGDAVERIKIILNNNPTLVSGNPIPPIEIQIILKDKYDSPNKDNLTININNLGNAK
ncbi:MAG: hypothetical protein ACRDCD_00160, partial [Mycoplasmoidaceae bacterium]